MSELLASTDIAEIVFWPRPAPIPAPFIVTCDDSAELACHFHEYDPGAHTVVFFHGNGEVVAEYINVLPKVFEIIRCNTFLVEYRGYGGSSGTPNLSNLISDCKPLLAQVPSPAAKLIFFGRSLGCIPAIESASLRPSACGLILESGVSDLYEYIRWILNIPREVAGTFPPLGLPFEKAELDLLRKEVCKKFSVPKKLRRFTGRSLVTYSINDSPQRQIESKTLFEWLPNPKRLRNFADCDHNSILLLHIKEYCEEILTMVTRSCIEPTDM